MSSNIRRANGSARNKVVAQVKREEHICHLCKREVDKSLPAGRPLSPEVDELIPVSRGGNPLDRNNCRLAHRICNQRRGNKPLGAPKVEQLQPLKTNRKW